MFQESEFEGKDLEQALQIAAESLGIPEPELDYEIVEPGRRGLFGVGARSVRIRVMPPLAAVPDPLAEAEPIAPGQPDADTGRADGPQRTPRGARGGRRRDSRRSRSARPREAPAEPPRSAAPVEPGAAGSDTSAAEIVTTLQRILDLMGLELEARSAEAGDGVTIELDGPDRKSLTRKEGDLLHALQFLLNRMSRRTWPDVGQIHLSCNGERGIHRDDELTKLTREAAEQVRSTGKSRRLPPMNAYERRLVHLTVREYERLGSRSEGSGHTKRVKIFRQADPTP